MLISLRQLNGYSVQVAEGWEIGRVDRFYFDDEKWTIRYVIINTGPWYNQTKVLLPPISIKTIDFINNTILTDLPQDQILQCPDINTEKPISRKMEAEYLDHYKWPYYWTGAGIWGSAATLEGNIEFPPSLEDTAGHLPKTKLSENESDVHLRSTKEILGYRVDANDGEFGRVDDLIVNKPTWVVWYFVIHLRRQLPSRSVLISREWVKSVNWHLRTIQVSLSQSEIKSSPYFDPELPLSREYEDLIHTHYGRTKYWENKSPKSAA